MIWINHRLQFGHKYFIQSKFRTNREKQNFKAWELELINWDNWNKKITGEVQSHATNLSGLIGARSTRPPRRVPATSPSLLSYFSLVLPLLPSILSRASQISPMSRLSSLRPHLHRVATIVGCDISSSQLPNAYTQVAHTHLIHTTNNRAQPRSSLLFFHYFSPPPPTSLQLPTKPTTAAGLRGRVGILPLRPSPLNQHLQPI